MPDEIRNILTFGQQIMERVWCSESDIVYHMLAPLLVATGWKRREIHFEWGQRKSISDIALIPSGVTKPILTVEAKAPNQKIGLYVEGWSRRMDITDIRKRNDPERQVFLQLVNIRHYPKQAKLGAC